MKTTTLFSVALATVVSARTFTVKNNCAFTVWPAIFTDLNVGSLVPNQPTGWEAAPGSSVSFSVPDQWKAGRIWGRRECDFSNPNGATACASGACNGGLLCDPHTGTGVPPATVAEWTLSAGGNLDYYDISLVDGFNIPMAITNNKGCHVADCPAHLNLICPTALQLPGRDGAGDVVGCKSDCLVDPNPANSPSCCSGSHNTPATCPNTGVPHYTFFKSNCPNAYAYAYDESSGTALWTCDDNLKADYTLTFCP